MFFFLWNFRNCISVNSVCSHQQRFHSFSELEVSDSRVQTQIHSRVTKPFMVSRRLFRIHPHRQAMARVSLADDHAGAHTPADRRRGCGLATPSCHGLTGIFSSGPSGTTCLHSCCSGRGRGGVRSLVTRSLV